MKKLGSKLSGSSILFSKFTLIMILVLCAFFAFSVYERYTVEREMSDRRTQSEAEYQSLQERKDSLLDRVDYLKGEGGIESEIRKNFDVAREGEKVVIIVDDESGNEVKFTEGLNPSVIMDHPWWQFWR